MTQTKGEILLGFYKKAKAKRIVATQEEFAGLLNYSRSQLIRFFNGDDVSDELLHLAKEIADGTFNVSRGTHVSEPAEPYLKRRQAQKNHSGPFMVPLVPVTAQAGYSQAYNNTDFINQLEYYPIVPGIDPHGAISRHSS